MLRTVIARVDVGGLFVAGEIDGFDRYLEKPPDREMLERFFFLDDADRELVAEHRGSHSRLGFALQLVTVRHVDRSLAEVCRAYHDGMEDQLDALGFILNCVTLWSAIYLDRAVTTLRAQGHPVRDVDAAYQYAHLNVHGHYSFVLPDLAGGHRPLRNPDQAPPV
ncbi:DUF4158 domain-containing protein [Micromonospora sp. B11E3]|uniref:DUF4158 domain-containing protein n=1 Tax=Micromonospora sp. B11E3 TaxID=3153562 RepID=UPI00325F99D6